MLKLNRHVISRQHIAGTLGPFDQYECLGTEDLVPSEIRQIVGATKPVEIEMVDRRSRAREFMHEREGWAGDCVRHPVAATDGAGERRFPRAEISAERHNEWRTSSATKTLSPVDQLGLGEGEVPFRRQWRQEWRLAVHRARGFN